MHRRPLVFSAAAIMLTLAALVPAARAATLAPFEPAAFAAAQAAGKPILVDIWASWCPTCKSQQPILNTVAADPANADLIIFRVDFDAQKDVVRALRASMQSTLVAFHGSTETARSVGDTQAASIKALVASCHG